MRPEHPTNTGPSAFSSLISSNAGRRVVFDASNDGFFDQDGIESYSTFTVTSSATLTSSALVTITESGYPGRRLVTLSTGSHTLTDNDKVVFTSDDTNWDNVELTIYPKVEDTGAFYVLTDRAVPTETVTFVPSKTKIAFTINSEEAPIVGDIARITVTGFIPVAGVISEVVTTGSPYVVIKSYTSDDYESAAKVLFEYVANNTITYRNLYRNSSTGGFYLVDKIPCGTLEYEDSISDAKLGNVCPSYYVEDGVTIVTNEPPINITGLVRHYDMLFGIEGDRVKWTDNGLPDSWPDVFYMEGFASRPVKLVSFDQSLTVLCQNDVYRIDGNRASRMSLTRCPTEDGCMAPYTAVKTTDYGLLYVSKRGIMAFDGMRAKCITDSKIPSELFWGTSSYDYNSGTHIEPLHTWLPTLATYNYANLAYHDGILASIPDWVKFTGTHYSATVNKDMKAFYNNGKYYVYWMSKTGGSFQGHTMICIDMVADGSITTLGLKPVDVHVNESGKIIALVDAVKEPSMTLSIDITIVGGGGG